MVRTLTPNPVAAHPESGCTTNDAPTLGIRLPPACAIAILTPRRLLMIVSPASDVPSCCVQKVDVAPAKPFNPGVCIRDPLAAACPSVFEQALIDFDNLMAADRAHLNIITNAKCSFDIVTFFKAGGQEGPLSPECEGILGGMIDDILHRHQ